MARGDRSTSEGADFGASLARKGAGAFLIVGVAAGLFVALGVFGGGFDGLAIGDDGGTPAEESTEPVAPPVAVPPEDTSAVPADEAPTEEVAEEPEPDRIDPATVTVQVLDGYKIDGGTAATGVESKLSEFGYDIVETSTGKDYEVSAVFWGVDGEEAARQLAADLGIDDVRPNPGTLRDDIMVHVMVGSDQV